MSWRTGIPISVGHKKRYPKISIEKHLAEEEVQVQ